MRERIPRRGRASRAGPSLVVVVSLAGLLLIAFLVVLFLTPELRSQVEMSTVQASRSLPKELKPIVQPTVEGSNAFAFDVYHRLRARPGNLFLSPFSISTALAMTYAGAAGTTEAEMARVLRLPAQRADLPKAYATLLGSLEKGTAAGGYRLNIANRLWGRRGEPFLTSFLKTTREGYGAGLEQMDFSDDPEGSRKTINDWVERKTEGKIADLLQSDSIDSLTKLVLINAIYFYGMWAVAFDSSQTRVGPFHLSQGSKVEVPLMNRMNEFAFAKLDGLSALEMPYKSGDVTMVVLLPDSVDGLAEMEKRLSAAALGTWLAVLKNQKVIVTLPRFRMTSEFVLNDVLAELGMTSAFDAAKADFSGMNGKRDLFISLVIHKAFVEVNEKGTEAAAATAVVTRSVSIAMPPSFRADHPFVFLIRDKVTGSILFLGRVVDPAKGAA